MPNDTPTNDELEELRSDMASLYWSLADVYESTPVDAPGRAELKKADKQLYECLRTFTRAQTLMVGDPHVHP